MTQKGKFERYLLLHMNLLGALYTQKSRTAGTCLLPPFLNNVDFSFHAVSLTGFVENTCNICISKLIYYENRFNDLSNDINFVP